jgi:hypothetical protein
MNKISFIIPVYPPHYNFLDFLNKIDDKIDFDIILVLSFNNDKNELLKYNYKKNYKLIILEKYLDNKFIETLINNKIIITFKKYFALNLVKNDYLYCATVDSEIEFVNTNNIFDKFKTFCNTKKIIGSCINTNDFRHKLIKDINLASAIFYKDTEYYDKLIDITKKFNLFFWFSDIPIYDMSYITAFFEFIGFNDYDKFIKKTTWYVFDYIPYVYFVTLFNGYSMINIKDYGLTREWSLESMPIQTYKQVIEKINYRPLWLIHNTYNENKTNIGNNDIILTYHRNDGRSILVNDY